MKNYFLIFTCLFFVKMIGQVNNMDFEEGNFNGWEIDLGRRTSLEDVNWNDDQGQDLEDHFTIVDKQMLDYDPFALLCDPSLEIPVVYADGGNYTAMIGNLFGRSYASKLSKTFQVPADSAYLFYNYAVNMNDPGHRPGDPGISGTISGNIRKLQPYFLINIKDASGQLIQCGEFEVFAGDDADANGFLTFNEAFQFQCDRPLPANECQIEEQMFFEGRQQILPWTAGAVDLTNYIGQDVTVEFIVFDCFPSHENGAHGAYAFVEAKLTELVIQNDGYCSSSNTATLTAPPGFVSYLWSTGETTQEITINNPVEGTVYTVELTPVAGSNCATTAEYVLELKPEAQINPIEDRFACQGSTVRVEITGTNADSFLIEYPDGTTEIVNGTLVLEPQETSTYTVTALNENNCEGDSTTFTIEVSDRPGGEDPEASFTMERIDSEEGCNVIQFTNNSSYCLTALSYSWDFGDGSPISTEENPLHVFPDTVDPQDYTVVLTVTGDDGESNSISEVYTSISGSITPLFEIISNACLVVEIRNQSRYCGTDFSDITFLTYSWDFGDGSIPVETDENQAEITHTYTTAGVYTITMTMTNTVNNQTSRYDQEVTVNSSVTPDFNYVADDCLSVTFEDTSQACNPITSYSWDFGDGSPISTEENPTHVYTESGSYEVVLTVDDGSGVESETKTIQVTASPPEPQFTFSSLCIEIQFNNTSTSCLGILSYQWDFGDDSPINSEENPSHAYETAGTYTVTLTVDDGQTTQSVSQSVDFAPEASVPAFTYDISCSQVQFTNESTSCVQDVTYSWDFGDGSPVSTEVNPIHNYQEARIFTVRLIVNDGIQDYETTQNITTERDYAYELPVDLESCEVGMDEQLAVFDLQEQTDIILANTADVPQITYHESEADATEGSNPVGINYETSTQKTLYVRIEGQDGCFDVLPFDLNILPAPSITIEGVFLCMEQGDTLTYELEQLLDFIQNQTGMDLNYTYHETSEDASLNQNAITSIILEAGVPSTVFVRAEDTSPEKCFFVTEANILADNKETDEMGLCFIKISNTMTPNGDSVNDAFIIDGVEQYPDNKLSIYNRWGNQVYQTKGYVNTWEGTYQGKQLPVGTYYYVLELNDDRSRKYSGYISIIR